MSKIDDGGPAFAGLWKNDTNRNVIGPNGALIPPGGEVFLSGLSIRDWFAGQALPTIIHLTLNNDGSWDADACAAGAYAVSDAMLRTRKIASE